MNALPAGIFLGSDKRFEFDFEKFLLKISHYQDDKPAGSIVSPLRVLTTADALFLLVHSYDRQGESIMAIETIGVNEVVISHNNLLYTLKKVA